MSVIEKAARAVIEDATRQNPNVWMDWLTAEEEEAAEDGTDPRHPTRFHSQHEPLDALQLVRAVLQAIREPSEGMVEAAMAHWGSSSSTSPATAQARGQIYTAMIDAALSE